MTKRILALAALALMFTSCVRDYNCQCTYTNVEDPTDTYVTDSKLRNDKKGAEANCDLLDGGISYSGSVSHSKSCELLKE